MPLPLAGSSRAYTPFYRTEAVATSPEVSLSALAHDFYPTLIQRSSAISAPSRYGGQDSGRFGKAARRQQADEWPQGRIDTPDKLRPILRSHQVGSRHELRRNPASSRGLGDHRDLCFATIAHAGNRSAARRCARRGWCASTRTRFKPAEPSSSAEHSALEHTAPTPATGTLRFDVRRHMQVNQPVRRDARGATRQAAEF